MMKSIGKKIEQMQKMKKSMDGRIKYSTLH